MATPFPEHECGESATGGSGRVSATGNAASEHPTGQINALLAQNQELRAELECLKADRARMGDILNRLMQALGTSSVERIVHDVRNVMNERELYRALADAST